MNGYLVLSVVIIIRMTEELAYMTACKAIVAWHLASTLVLISNSQMKLDKQTTWVNSNGHLPDGRRSKSLGSMASISLAGCLPHVKARPTPYELALWALSII